MNNFSRREMIGLLGAAWAGRAAGSERPNILYIMADDHASHAISAYGSVINKTPNLDRIASGGIRLTNCFCTNSICTPSRAAILTGQYSNKNGVYTLNDQIDPARNNVAKELQHAGYQTAMIGKWQIDRLVANGVMASRIQRREIGSVKFQSDPQESRRVEIIVGNP